MNETQELRGRISEVRKNSYRIDYAARKKEISRLAKAYKKNKKTSD